MSEVQGYHAHKTPPPRRTLQEDYVQGPMVVLARGGGVLISEVPMYPCTYRSSHSLLRVQRCQANVAFIRQSRPDSGIGFQSKALKPFEVVFSSLGGGCQGTDYTPMSQNVLIKWLEKVNSSTKPSAYCLLLLIETIN